MKLILFALITLAVAAAASFSATLATRDAIAADSPAEATCAQGPDRLAASVSPGDSGLAEDQGVSHDLDDSLEEVHSAWDRRCLSVRVREYGRRWVCDRVRVNEGGGYYSYVNDCGWRLRTNWTTRRYCWEEWREHRHTMLPRDPFRQAVDIA